MTYPSKLPEVSRILELLARIKTASGKDVTLGYFDEVEDAIDARVKANDIHGYHANHGRAAE